MITMRPARDRGQVNFGWLDSQHSFSFGHYYDPAHMGFATLRVINEDKIAPDRGFDRHGHRDMEILTYVLEGALEHKDSLGNGEIIRPGDVQRMTAGTGILHSEYNASSTDPVHLLQIWILPDRAGLSPSYEQIHITENQKRGQLRLIASKDGRAGSVTIHQAVDLYATVLDEGQAVRHTFETGHRGWIQVARGSVTIGDRVLSAGDGAAIVDESELILTGSANGTEVLLFDFGV